MTTTREALASVMRERDLQDAILEAASAAGWLAYHTHDSRRSEAGFPDLVLVSARRRRLIFAELKAQTKRPTPEQQRWLDALEETAGLVLEGAEAFQAIGDRLPEVYVWRPSDWLAGTIARLLA